jgi:hypothetical protein
MTPEEMRALHPELFAIAEELRARGGDVRIRCIRDEQGNVLAGKMPPPDPPHWAQIVLKGNYKPPAEPEEPPKPQPYRGRRR